MKSKKKKKRVQGTCRRCGRALRTADSVAVGFGPTCWEKREGTVFQKLQAMGQMTFGFYQDRPTFCR